MNSFILAGALRSVKLTVVTGAGALALICIVSAADRAGQSWATIRWGTSAARSATIDAMALGDAGAAIDSARAGIVSDPVSRPSASILAEALLLDGEVGAAAHAYRLAARTGWRDGAAQRWALGASIANKDWTQAAIHLDAILRTAPQDKTVTPWLKAIEAQSSGRTALAERLSHSPIWAAGWVRSTGDLPVDALNNRIATILEAKSLGASVPDTVAADASWQMAQQHPEQAFSFWLALAGIGDSIRDNIWDAGFNRGELSSPAGPFQWLKTDRTGVEVRYGARPQPHLNIEGLKVTSSTLLETRLALAPGRYTLTSARVGPPAPVRFSIECLQGRAAISHSISSFASDRSSLGFEVPPGCLLQKLSLVADGATGGESGGTIGRLHISKRQGSNL